MSECQLCPNAKGSGSVENKGSNFGGQHILVLCLLIKPHTELLSLHLSNLLRSLRNEFPTQ